MNNNLIKAYGLWKIYNQGGNELNILKGVDFEVSEKEAVCIVGASGTGKSTLLHILGALDRPSSGEVYYKGESVFDKTDDQLALFRNQEMGFVFQFHHLLPEFTALENVMMPAKISGTLDKKSREKALILLDQLNLVDRLRHYPSQLSGGEQQRVAIARALINDPKILFCDEPTGNLDSKSSQVIQDLFFELKDKMGLALVVVTHNLQFAEKFHTKKILVDGQWAN